MSPELVGILGTALLLILFALRMQVGLSMLIVGFLGFTYLSFAACPGVRWTGQGHF
jgi:hypothetical protein